MNEFRNKILRLLAHPQGLRVTNLPLTARQPAGRLLHALEEVNLAFPAKVGRGITLWFSTKIAAEAAVDKTHAELGLGFEKSAAKKARKIPQNAPLVYHPDFKGITYCPGFIPRESHFPPNVASVLQRGRVAR